MKRFQFGIPKRESLPNPPPFSSLSDGLDMHYNRVSSDSLSPPDAMPNRPNLTRSNLTLDVQSFQDLLSAAYTIQEHNEHRRQARPSQPEPQASPVPPAASVCPQCGAPKPDAGSHCENCGPDQLRPGERLQRNWASMWLMSQEQGLWPERSPETSEPARTELPPPERRPQDQAPRTIAASGSLALPVAREVAEETVARQKPGTIAGTNYDRVNGKSAVSKAAAENERTTETNEDLANEDLVTEDSDQTIQLSASEDSFLAVATGDETPDGTIDASAAARPLIQRLADLRVVLRFHRADVYLGAAIFVAVFALLWPAATSPRPAALGPWERALITLGIAEAPAPVVHLQGDPGIEVWIDPHTALYYCPGDELYGKAAGGRLTSQHEAQMDRFEPASRSACE
jgi:ribosomal protein L40E